MQSRMSFKRRSRYGNRARLPHSGGDPMPPLLFSGAKLGLGADVSDLREIELSIRGSSGGLLV
jgi:hypothetical protein